MVWPQVGKGARRAVGALVQAGCFTHANLSIKSPLTPLSKLYKTKDQAEKARLKLPERERRSVGVGVIRIKK
jgi:hypothetical protein